MIGEKNTTEWVNLPTIDKTNKHRSVIYKVFNAIDHKVITSAQKDIDKHPTYLIRPNEQCRLFSLNLGFSQFDIFSKKCFVYFNEECKMTDKKQLHESIEDATESVKALVYEGVESLSKSVGFKNMWVGINPHILRYQLDTNNPTINGLSWHNDPCDLTMSILISEGKQTIKGYSGGGLSFASKNYELSPLCYHPMTVKYFEYGFNHGFIFDNKDTMHKAEDLYLKGSESAEKQLLMLLTWPGESFVNNLWERNRIASNNES